MIDVAAYLERIGWSGPVANDLADLERLQRAHLTHVPFENLFVEAGLDVRTDPGWAWDKVVGQRRGGWCFELNGLFAELLSSLGFETRLLGAAVQLGGPNDVVDHATIEVALAHPDDGRPWPHLVDVGFGESFIRPLDLTVGRPQDGGTGCFQFFPSPRGTTLTRLVDDVPEAQFRFKRVTLHPKDFTPASERLRHDAEGLWRTKRFATRLLDGGPDRVTLTGDRLRIVRHGVTEETHVSAAEWSPTLRHWFALTPPARSASTSSRVGTR